MDKAISIATFAFAAVQTVVAVLLFFGIGPPKSNEGSAVRHRHVLIGIVLFLVSIALSGVGLYRTWSWQEPYQDNTVLAVVYGKSFKNEVVDVDGKDFRRCRFTNVRLRFNGHRGVKITDSDFEGSTGLDTQNPTVAATFALVAEFSKETHAPIYREEPNGPVTRDR